MKKSLSVVAGLSFLAVSNSFGIVWQSDGTVESVQYIHNYQAADGDTITVPSGTFTWTTQLVLTKAITLKGNTTVDVVNGSANDVSTIIHNVSVAPISLGGSGGQRVTGLTFKSNASTGSEPCIQVTGTPKKCRIDHNHFNDPPATNLIGWAAYNYGVVDHNYANGFQSPTGFVHCWMGANTDLGDAAWNDPIGWGSANFLFIEDNFIGDANQPDGTITGGGTDNTQGGKLVFRYNKILGYSSNGAHDTGRSGRDWRGGRGYERYHNTQTWGHNGKLSGTTSGPILVYDDTYLGPNQPTATGFGNYRRMQNFGTPFFAASGFNAWDYNATEADETHVDGHPPFLLATSSGNRRGVANSTSLTASRLTVINNVGEGVINQGSGTGTYFHLNRCVLANNGTGFKGNATASQTVTHFSGHNMITGNTTGIDGASAARWIVFNNRFRTTTDTANMGNLIDVNNVTTAGSDAAE